MSRWITDPGAVDLYIALGALKAGDKVRIKWNPKNRSATVFGGRDADAFTRSLTVVRVNQSADRSEASWQYEPPEDILGVLEGTWSFTCGDIAAVLPCGLEEQDGQKEESPHREHIQ